MDGLAGTREVLRILQSCKVTHGESLSQQAGMPPYMLGLVGHRLTDATTFAKAHVFATTFAKTRVPSGVPPAADCSLQTLWFASTHRQS